MAAASAFDGRQNEVERRFPQVGDVANLAGQVKQVRYDVWHWCSEVGAASRAARSNWLSLRWLRKSASARRTYITAEL